MELHATLTTLIQFSEPAVCQDNRLARMGLLWVTRWPVKLLLFVTVCTFSLYCVLMSVNAVLLSSVFTGFAELCYFPFMAKAMDKGEKEHFVPFSEDALYRAGVSLNYPCCSLTIRIHCGLRIRMLLALLHPIVKTLCLVPCRSMSSGDPHSWQPC